jgi:hypothetical protein
MRVSPILMELPPAVRKGTPGFKGHSGKKVQMAKTMGMGAQWTEVPAGGPETQIK